MITLELSVFERVLLAQWVAGQRGDVGFVRRALGVLEVLELSAADEEMVQFARDREGNARWADTERMFVLELDERALEVLKPALQDQAWPVNPLVLRMLEKVEQAG